MATLVCSARDARCPTQNHCWAERKCRVTGEPFTPAISRGAMADPPAEPKPYDAMTDYQKAHCLALARDLDKIKTYPGGAEFVADLVAAAIKEQRLLIIDTTALTNLLLTLKRADELCRVALPSFGWGKSPLTAAAIRLLNEVPGEIATAIANAKAG